MTSVWDQRLGFWWIAQDHPELPAILASPDGPRTYAELAGDAHQLVHLLRSLGVAAGDPIAIIADNGTTLVETSLACHESGLGLILLNTHLTGSELAAILEHSGARVLILDERFAPLLADVDLGGLGVRVLTTGTVAGMASLAEMRSVHPTTVPDDRSPGTLFAYTSGTTGKPKGIRRPIPDGPVDEVANNSALFGRAFNFVPFDGPMLVSTGMFHGGSHSFYMGGLNVGHALVIMDRFEPVETLRLIEKYRVRTGYMVATQFHRMLQLPDELRLSFDVSSLHGVVHSAAPCPRPLKERMMDWWGPVLWETYGGMEGAATIAKPHRWLEKPGTVGRAVRGVQLWILDDDGNELPPGEVGHIYMDTGGFEYYNDPEQTAAAYKGRRHTIGDIGHLDEDGYLFISDRAKDMIITGGTNVYPAEIEAVLHEHPAIRDVAVIGIPDDEWGETVTAVVQTMDGIEGTDALAAEIMAFAADHLASYKKPRRVQFRAELPRTEAGKLLKRLLRDETTTSRNHQ